MFEKYVYVVLLLAQHEKTGTDKALDGQKGKKGTMVKVDNKCQAVLQSTFHRYCKCSELVTLLHVTPSFKGGDVA